MSDKVILSVYDITNGLAKQMSMAFIGQQVDAVYHSSLVAFGKEYYFGGGICIDNVDQTPYGKPIEKIELGQT